MDLGLILPLTNGGMVVSKTAPHPAPTFAYADEYATVLRELWENGRSSFQGRHYELDDCELGFDSARDIGLICAGQSDRGLRFVAEHGDYSYILGAGGLDGVEAVVSKLRTFTERTEREVKTLAVCICIVAETDEEAHAKERRYVAEADREAIATIRGQAELDLNGGTAARILDLDNSTYMNIDRVIGSPATVAKHFDDLAAIEGIGGCMINFDDWGESVDLFGREVMPRMRSRAGRAVAPAL